MRRLLSITLLALFCLPLLTPLVGRGDGSFGDGFHFNDPRQLYAELRYRFKY